MRASLYEALGIAPTASDEEVRAALRRLIRNYYAKTRDDYNRLPPRPVIDGEPIYEGHPIAFKPDEFGHSVAADVRRALYWDLFSGACGHTYGHHSIWQ